MKVGGRAREDRVSACTLGDPKVKAVLDRLHREGKGDKLRYGLKLLPPRLRQGGVVLADDVLTPFIKRTLAGYVAYMQDDRHGFASVTVPFRDGFEYSVKA